MATAAEADRVESTGALSSQWCLRACVVELMSSWWLSVRVRICGGVDDVSR